jgi:hypothetical protein
MPDDSAGPIWWARVDWDIYPGTKRTVPAAVRSGGVARRVLVPVDGISAPESVLI